MGQVVVITLFILAAGGFAHWYYFVALPLLKFTGSHRKEKPILAVTVVVCAKNEALLLPALIEALKSQDYPHFEVLILDDSSEDNTANVVSKLISDDQRFSLHRLSPDQKKLKAKKGVVAYAYQHLNSPWILHTDADCVPASNQWVSLMMESTEKDDTTIVLGIGSYQQGESWWQSILNVETTLIALQYMGTALKGKSYMAVGRNVAVHYDVYKNVNFTEDVLSGDDDLLIQQHATSKNVAVQMQQKAHTISALPHSFSAYLHMKQRHISAGGYYRWSDKIKLMLWPLSLWCSWLGLFLVADPYSLVFLVLLFGRIFILAKISSLIHHGTFGVKLLIVETYLSIQSLIIYIANLIRPVKKWN